MKFGNLSFFEKSLSSPQKSLTGDEKVGIRNIIQLSLSQFYDEGPISWIEKYGKSLASEVGKDPTIIDRYANGNESEQQEILQILREKLYH